MSILYLSTYFCIKTRWTLSISVDCTYIIPLYIYLEISKPITIHFAIQYVKKQGLQPFISMYILAAIYTFWSIQTYVSIYISQTKTKLWLKGPCSQHLKFKRAWRVWTLNTTEHETFRCPDLDTFKLFCHILNKL